MKYKMLSTKQVEKAKNARTHIVIRTLNSFGYQHWTDFKEQYGSGIRTQEQLDLSGPAFSSFAERLESEKFTLKSLEIISIWSRVEELFTNMDYAKHRIASAISYAYCSRGLFHNCCNHYSKELQNTRYLSNIFAQHPQDALAFKIKMDEIDGSLKRIRYYATGERENPFSNIPLQQRDPLAIRKRLERITKWMKTHDEKLMGEIQENWGNGFYYFYASFLNSTNKRLRGEIDETT